MIDRNPVLSGLFSTRTLKLKLILKLVLLASLMLIPHLAQASQENISVQPRNGCPDLIDLIKNLTPSVVSISIERGNPGKTPQKADSGLGVRAQLPNGTGFVNTFQADTIGSGFFYDSNGHIVTNAHVVEGADKIFVTLATGKVLDAVVVATHPRVDLALLKVDPPMGARAASLGRSDDVQVGEWVLAVGNPFGLGRTVTVGIVSGKGRFLGFSPDDNFIQTDASINPGNSGGPLFNMAGEVIGVNTAIISSGKGIGFSIPSSFIRELATVSRNSHEKGQGWLGVYVDDAPESRQLSKGSELLQGAVVDEVMTSTPAHKAGLMRGDIIISADETQIRNSQDLSLIVSRVKPGRVLRMTVLRENRRHDLNVVMGSPPK